MALTLDDIIKTERDRLFVIDRECFIVFTGDSLDDEKPFIRIGTYVDLPVEIIPLVENIVITDTMVGNPAIEQFNIDITYLDTNRFIGSRAIVRRYLEFQKVFGLDLGAAKVVDIDTDIPDISNERLISNRDSFVGIFYKNGNFKIIHNNRDIFNLQEIDREGNQDIARAHDALSEAFRGTARYRGCGLCVIDNNPLLYRKGAFAAYQFPKRYYERFAALEIDPQSIKDIALPAANLLHVAGFLKWKHARAGRIRIFSDNREGTGFAQRLFREASIAAADFTGFSADAGGARITHYPGGFNIKVVFPAVEPARADVSVAYCKGRAGIETIVRERLDAILVNYSVFEDANLIFKSTDTPLAIIDDGSKNISRLPEDGRVIIRQGVQYEFRACGDFDELARSMADDYGLGGAAETIASGDAGAIGALFADADPARAANLRSAIRAHIDTVTDRRLAGSLRKILQEHAAPSGALDAAGGRMAHLVFFRRRLYQFILPPPERTVSPVSLVDEIRADDAPRHQSLPDRKVGSFYERIVDDRRRLDELLRLYAERHKPEPWLGELREAIELRKREFFEDDLERANVELARAAQKKKMIRLAKMSGVIAAIALGIVLATVTAVNVYRVHKERERLAFEERERARIIAAYGIRISDTDVFHYANAIAVKNGYNRISLAHIRGKNPNWIYPKNVFVLPDGERITVAEGDTLWGIAHRKLLQANIDFYRAIELATAKRARGESAVEEIARATSLALTPKHRDLVEALKRDGRR